MGLFWNIPLPGPFAFGARVFPRGLPSGAGGAGLGAMWLACTALTALFVLPVYLVIVISVLISVVAYVGIPLYVGAVFMDLVRKMTRNSREGGPDDRDHVKPYAVEAWVLTGRILKFTWRFLTFAKEREAQRRALIRQRIELERRQAARRERDLVGRR